MKKRVILQIIPMVFLSACFLKQTDRNVNNRTGYINDRQIPRNGAVDIAGVNWADVRDNFVNDKLIPSGLSSLDNYIEVRTKANVILSVFKNDGINTIRLPINPPTATSKWWKIYKGTADEALSKNMKVIFSCWEADSSRNGKVDDLKLFWPMWKKVIRQYGKNSNVYFEVFNEPHGYKLVELKDLYLSFLARHPSIPRNRILLGGTGYSEDVTKIGDDSLFDGCLLAIHDYSFFVKDNIKTTEQWEARLRRKIGPYAKRTVMTEFGAVMTSKKDYVGEVNDDGQIAYIQGITNVMQSDGLAGVYWPGLRDKDSFSLYSLVDSKLMLNNPSGLSRLLFGWDIEIAKNDSLKLK